MNYRTLSRQLFPHFSRSQRARWVVAKMKAHGTKVPISSQWVHDTSYWAYRRSMVNV